jgi:hypothetical protein
MQPTLFSRSFDVTVALVSYSGKRYLGFETPLLSNDSGSGTVCRSLLVVNRYLDNVLGVILGLHVLGGRGSLVAADSRGGTRFSHRHPVIVAATRGPVNTEQSLLHPLYHLTTDAECPWRMIP